MTEREPRKPSSGHAGASPASGSSGDAAVDAHVLEAVRRAAAHGGGLALLEHAPIDCAAVLLSLHPRDLERARAVLANPAVRAAVDAILSSAPPATPGAAAPPEPRAAPRTAEALVAEAERRSGGAALLASAAPECAAVIFGVRPDLVLAARAMLARRARPSPAPAEEDGP